MKSTSGRRRVRTLSDQLTRYAKLQLHRCRSDAEINVRIAGEEADLSWPDRRFILEIDGATFHEDKFEDARKTAVWRAAGYDVERVPADVVYDDPQQLIRAARQGS